MSGPILDQASNPMANLVNRYPLFGNTDARDLAGSASVDIGSAVTQVTGPGGIYPLGALTTTDLNTGDIQLTSASDPPQNQDLAFSFWFRRNGAPAAEGALLYWGEFGAVADRNGVGCVLNNTSRLRLLYYNAGSVTAANLILDTSAATVNLVDGDWHHVAVRAVYNSGTNNYTHTVQFDGESITLDNATGGADLPAIAVGQQAIGAFTNASQRLDCSVSDVRFWHTDIPTTSEMAPLAAKGSSFIRRIKYGKLSGIIGNPLRGYIG